MDRADKRRKKMRRSIVKTVKRASGDEPEVPLRAEDFKRGTERGD